MPKITIVTPSYNQGQYLEQTICSVLEQRYPNLEYIVMDGGSTDNSVEIIKRYAHRLAYWESGPDAGQSSAINKGLRRAEGSIVCWLNSDDLFLPGALHKVSRAFAQNPNVQMITGYTIRTDSHLRLLFNHYVPVQTRWLAKRGVVYMCQPSTFWKRELLEEVGYLDESLHNCMDQDLWLRFFTVGVKIAHLREFLAVWRLHDECKTMKDVEGRNRDKAVLRVRYEKMHYGNEAMLGRLAYRTWKLVNGDYLRGIAFRLKWEGHPVCEFTRSLSL